MKILGLDPGLRVTGYGVIEKMGAVLVYIASGCIKSPDGESAEEYSEFCAGDYFKLRTR